MARDLRSTGSHLSGEADKSSSSLRDIDPSRNSALTFCRKCDEQELCAQSGCAWYKSYPKSNRDTRTTSEAATSDVQAGADSTAVLQGSAADAIAPADINVALTEIAEIEAGFYFLAPRMRRVRAVIQRLADKPGSETASLPGEPVARDAGRFSRPYPDARPAIPEGYSAELGNSLVRELLPSRSDGWPKSMDTAPKDGTIFLAHYDSTFGPRVGPMHWTVEERDHSKRRFHSWAMLTETARATHWEPLPPAPAGEARQGQDPQRLDPKDDHAVGESRGAHE